MSEKRSNARCQIRNPSCQPQPQRKIRRRGRSARAEMASATGGGVDLRGGPHCVTATLRFRLDDLSGYFSDVPHRRKLFLPSGTTGWRCRADSLSPLRRAHATKPGWWRWSARAGTAACSRGFWNVSGAARARLVQRGAARRRCANWRPGAGAAMIWPSRRTARAARVTSCRKA